MKEIIMDSVLDCLKLLPFLYLSYLLVEYAEHQMSSRTKELIYRAGKAGPVLGALIGIIPQCGFSAAAAGLFAGGMVSPGTLIAVFLSTSDEMLPVMISAQIAPESIFRILAVKVAAGAITGLLVDFVMEKLHGQRTHMPEHPDMCEDDDCGCETHGIWYSAMSHTAKTAGFLFVISLGIGICMGMLHTDHVSQLWGGIPVMEEAVAAIVGMIPNCAASVLITQLFVKGFLRSGAMFAGLLCGAGTGILVMFRENHDLKQNLQMTAILYLSGLFFGILAGMLHVI